MVDDQFVKRGIIWFLILGVFILGFFVINPVLVAIGFGLLFAYMFGPLFRLLNKKIRSKNLCALIIIFSITILFLIPTIYFLPFIISQSFDMYQLIQNFEFNQIFNKFLSEDISYAVSSSVNNVLTRLISSIMSSLNEILKNLLTFVLQILVFIVVFYFVLRDSDKLKNYFSKLSPFSKRTEQRFLKEFNGITKAIIFGQVFIGALQGFVLWIGLFFLGVEGSVILSVMGAILSIIPLVGAWMVWLPVSIVLLSSGSVFQGVFLAIYGLLVVSTIDNIIRPYIIARRSNLSVPVSIIGIIGGIMFFGISGIVLGPLILAYILIIIDFYKEGRLNELFTRDISEQ